MIDSKLVIIEGSNIDDHDSFHDEIRFKFGLPSFYGRNMDALIDALSYLDDKSCNQSKYWQLGRNEKLIILVKSSLVFKEACKDLFLEFVEVIADVNSRYELSNSHTRILLQLE